MKIKKSHHSDPYVDTLIANIPDNYLEILQERTGYDKDTIICAINRIRENELVHRELQDLYYETMHMKEFQSLSCLITPVNDLSSN